MLGLARPPQYLADTLPARPVQLLGRTHPLAGTFASEKVPGIWYLAPILAPPRGDCQGVAPFTLRVPSGDGGTGAALAGRTTVRSHHAWPS